MADFKEVIFSSEVSGQQWNTCVWDLDSGASLQTYRGGSAASRTACLIGNDYLMSAVINKSAINVWALRKQDQIHMKMMSPGNVRAMAVTPCGQFCAAAIMEKIHLWQVCTGELIAAVVGHYQNVNCLKFTRDGSHLVSGGDDGLVIIWSLPRMIAGDHQKGIVYSWSHHSLPITDIHVGHGHTTARVVSSSLDHTCKMYDLVTGSLMCSFVFTTGVTSVTVDHAEMRLFAGAASGDVHVISLFNQPVTQERHITDGDTDGTTLTCKGHTKLVNCISVSMDGSHLVTGSHDWTVKVWDVYSCQCIRTLNHKGAITNVFLTLVPHTILDHTHTKPTQPIDVFKRFLVQPSNPSHVHGSVKVEPVNVFISGRDLVRFDDENATVVKSRSGEDIIEQPEMANEENTNPPKHKANAKQFKPPATEQMKEILAANRQLYKLAMNQVLDRSSK